MKISKKKEEILELLGKLVPQGQPQAAPAAPLRERSKPPPALGRDFGEAIASRRRALAALKERREKLGVELLEERLLSICRVLEDRISKIETILDTTERIAGTAARQTDAEPAAVGLDEMVPDLPISSKSAAPLLPAPASKKDDGPKKFPVPQHYMLSGQIEDQTLPDIIQLVSSNQKTGIFALEKENQKVELYFREGTMFHAWAGEGITGQNAFYSAMAMGTGRFYFKETSELPQEKTIDGNTQFMILEALRQIDEQRGGG